MRQRPWQWPASTCTTILAFATVASAQLTEAPPTSPATAQPPTATSATPPQPITRVSKGDGVLPNSAGQVWREYDISPYTSRITDQENPQQAIVDWILRETGTEVWFSEPLGILSANRQTLRVYHTPEMHERIRALVDRFVSSQGESQLLGLRLVTIGSPNWRARALPYLRPVNVQSPGVEAFLVSKENAAVLLAELRKRTDFREHNSPNLLLHNGQSTTITRTRPRSYVRTARLREGGWPSHEFVSAQINEGYSLEISPLFSLDGSVVDAVIRCNIDQVEKLVPVNLDLPAPTGQSQRVQIQVPQLVSWRLHERFRWPGNQVLLLTCGVVASPTPEAPNALGIPNPFAMGPSRADALLFIEAKGKSTDLGVPAGGTRNAALPNYHGRY